MSAGIFISYASQDIKVANTLCKALESRGFKCWISARDILPGENFQVSIVRAIRGARMMLLVFTGNSNNSEEMTKELVLASQHRLIVVPLRIEDVTPNEAFSYEFATRQWIDFFADWEAAMDQLSLRISSAIGADPSLASAMEVHPEDHPAAAPAALAPAPEPPPKAAAPAAAAAAAVAEAKPAPAPEPVKAEPPKPEPVKAEAAPALAGAVAAAGVASATAKAPAAGPAAKAPVQPPVQPPKAGATAAKAPSAPSPAQGDGAKKGSPVPLIIGIVVVLALAGGAALVLPGMLSQKPAATPAKPGPAPAAAALKPAVPAPAAANAAIAAAPPAAAPSAAATPASDLAGNALTNALAPTRAHKHTPKAAGGSHPAASEVPF